MSAQAVPASETTPFGHWGHMYYSFPQGFYHPSYTAVNLPVSAIPHSHSDSFHDRTFNFDPTRYFLPENVAQRQDRQLYDLNTAENRDNFHNFVLSGIHQHLYLVNNNVTRLNPQQRLNQRSDANKQDVSNNSDYYCTNLATTDPTNSLPGCTCTYSSSDITKSKTKITKHERHQGAAVRDTLKTTVSSKSGSDHEKWIEPGTSVGSSGQAATEGYTLTKHNVHNRSSQIPVWKIQDVSKKEIDTIHRLSSASETDTENGLNYHIQSYQTDHDILGSDAGDISALSTSSQDSDLCSCGKLGLNHSHTNCSNLSTRGSSDVPSDVSSYDSNLYRSQSPAEMGHTQNEGKGPPHQRPGVAIPVPNSASGYNHDSYTLPEQSSQCAALNSELNKLHTGLYGAPTVAKDIACREKLPQLDAFHSNTFSQQSIAKDSGVQRPNNPKCDLSELDRTKDFMQNQAVPPFNRGKNKNLNSIVNCNANSHSLSRPKFDLLCPYSATSTKIDNGENDRYYDTSETIQPRVRKGNRRLPEKYSRNSDVSILSNDTARLSPFISDWYQSGSESTEPYYDHHNSMDCDVRHSRGFSSTETNELTGLLNRTIPVIPCSCASNSATNDSDGLHQSRAEASKDETVLLGEQIAHSSSTGHKSDQCQICLSLQRISNLHRHAIQQGQNGSFPLQRRNECIYPLSRMTGQETKRLHAPTLGSMASTMGADEQLTTAIPTGAADELANVHDIHTSDELSISPSSSSSGERRKPFEMFNRIASPSEGFQQVQAKDTIVVTNRKGTRFVYLSNVHLSFFVMD